MRFILYTLLVCLLPLHANFEKDLNLALLKKAHLWLMWVTEEEENTASTSKECPDLSNVNNAWDNYKDVMKQSIVLIKKYPRKVAERLSEVFAHEHRNILPLVAFYMYAAERKEKVFRYYDAFNVMIIPANQDNLWVALIPFAEPGEPKHTNYSALIMDLNSHRIFTKD